MEQAGRRFKNYEDALAWLGEGVRANWQGSEIGDAAAETPRSVDERLIQCVWHDGMLLGRALTTLAGRALEVRHPGDWNHEAGPDFRRAELTVDGRPLKGDIEIHLKSSDWSAHGHDRNFDYNAVILHVFLQHVDGRRQDLLHNGRAVERLCLAPYLETDLDTLRQTLALDEYPLGEAPPRGRCAATIESLDPGALTEILDLAGDRRLEEKTARFAAQLSGESLDQVFYQALLTALGHKSGKTLYFLLSKRAPIAELAGHAAECPPAERIRRVEAVFYHVANLVPGADRAEPLDEPSQAYLDQLHRHWSRVAGYFGDRIIPATRRWYAGIRPVNFPCRRLAGAALLIGERFDRGLVTSLLELLWQSTPAKLDRKSVKRLVDRLAKILSVDADHYWTRRYVWGGKLTAHAQSLIGEGLARSLLFNAILPMALLAARRQGDAAGEATVFQLWRHFPTLAENQVVRLMRGRLFGESDRFAGLLLTEHRNQALFQIFNDCCNNRAADCSQCTLIASKAA